MTSGSATGEGTASAAAAAVPVPSTHYERQSCNAASALLLSQLHGQVSEAMFEQRVKGAVKAHEVFSGILAEHLLALVEVRDMFHDALGAAHSWDGVSDALNRLEEEIRHIRQLGGEEGENSGEQ